MAEPSNATEGNLRFASLACPGLPPDMRAVTQEVIALVGAQDGIETYGPPAAIIDLAPDDHDPATWRCQVGTALIGQAKPAAPLLVEDYRGLQALSLPHVDARGSLRDTWQRLADHARAMGWLLRPYWRISLPTTRSADGHLVPECQVSVFLDR